MRIGAAGAYLIALSSTFAIASWISVWSPITVASTAQSSSMRRPGCSSRRASTISSSSGHSSNGSGGRTSAPSMRASRTRLSISVRMRAPSIEIAEKIRRERSSPSAALRRKRSMYPSTIVSGVRSSCPASATNWRIWDSACRRSANADETCAAAAL